MHGSSTGVHPSALVRAFGIARMAVGAAAWLAPVATTRVFGLGADPGQPAVAQLFGSRELALGAVTAMSAGASRETALRVGVAVDVGDALATARQVHAGGVGAAGAVLTGLGAVLFAGVGITALRRGR